MRRDRENLRRCGFSAQVPRLVHLLGIAVSIVAMAAAQATGSSSRPAPVPQTPASRTSGFKIVFKVADENGVAVRSAIVLITPSSGGAALKGETDYSGRVEFDGLHEGSYEAKITRDGFYEKTVSVAAGKADIIEVQLDHLQELKEVMSVVYSPPAIDPDKTSTSQGLSGKEIVDIPYPSSRDIKNALPLMPGIVKDSNGNFHVEGAHTRQTNDQLDGFDITQPETGTLNLHVSADAVRSINVMTSSYSVQNGKGSGGVVELNTGMGDDRYRFSATDFIPSLQNRHGVTLNDWTPRATFSGPVKKGRAWFFAAADGQYKLNIVNALPRGQDTDPLWAVSNLAKTQVNLTDSNILSGGYLMNRFREEHNGLTRFNPVEATVDLRQSADMFYVRDQAFIPGGALLETGLAYTRYDNRGVPHGTMPFFITPGGNQGSYFKEFNDRSSRFQWLTSVVVPGGDWHGKHQFRVGVDVSRVNAQVRNDRRPTYTLRQSGTIVTETSFIGGARFSLHNFELGAYGEDRWRLSNRILVEGGLRVDHDELIPGASFSPRIASTILLKEGGDAKLTVGAGLYYDPTTLGLIERGLDAERVQLNFAANGVTPAGPPVAITFGVNDRSLKRPRFLNWNVGFEKKLPASLFLKLAFMEKRGANGFAFYNLGAPPALSSSLPGGRRLSMPRSFASNSAPFQYASMPLAANQPIVPSLASLPLPVGGARFQLTNIGRDRYDALEITVRRSFKQGYEFLASYVRSRAHSNAVIDFNPDSPLLSQQAGGPYAWDSPNRLISRGFLPLVKKFTVAYFLELHDGYPFSVFNQTQQLVGPPNSRRYPYYFSLNIHVERRFSFLGYNLAVRGGFDDITGRANPNSVNSNIDSPNFLTFGSAQRRAFTARIRFLGKK